MFRGDRGHGAQVTLKERIGVNLINEQDAQKGAVIREGRVYHNFRSRGDWDGDKEGVSDALNSAFYYV